MKQANKPHCLLFYHLNKLVVYELADYYRDKSRTINGSYTVLSSENFDQDEILTRISDFYQINKEVLLTPTSASEIGIINRYLIIFCLLIILSALVLAILTIYDIILHVKEIGVQKINGLSNFSIINRRTKVNLCLLFAISFIIDIYLFLSLEISPPNFFQFLLISQFLTIAYYILLQLIAYLIISHITISNLLKNFANFKIGVIIMYALKTIVLIICSSIIANVSLTLQELNTEKEKSDIWQNYSNYSTLEYSTMTEAGETDFLTNDGKSAEEMYKIFLKLEKQLNTFYIQYNAFPSSFDFYDYKEEIYYKTEETFETLTINKNYLEKLGFQENVQEEDGRFFLVPVKYKGQDLTHFFQAILYDLHYYSEQEELKRDELIVRIAYYNSDISTFSFDINKNTNINNPIFVVMDGSSMLSREKVSLENTTFSNPLKIPNATAVGNDVEKIVAENSSIIIPKFTKLGDLMNQAIQFQESSLLIVLIILVLVVALEIFVSLSLSSVIFYSNQHIIAVKRLIGLSFFAKYRRTLFVYLIIYTINAVLVISLMRTATVLPIFILVIALDAILSMSHIRKIESKQMSVLLKGG